MLKRTSDPYKMAVLMSVLILLAVAALVVVWLVLAFREPPPRRRNSSEYRHQHTENPDYMPGNVGHGI